MSDDLSEKLLTHYVAGAWRAPFGPRMLPVILPDGVRAGQIVCAGVQDVARAVAAAQAGRMLLSATPQVARRELVRGMARAVRGRADWLAGAVASARGLAHDAAMQEAMALADSLDAALLPGLAAGEKPFAGSAALLSARTASLGTIGGVLAGAVLSGGALVLKPAPGAAVVAARLMDVLASTGLPPGMVNLLQGDGPGSGGLVAGDTGFGHVLLAGGPEAAAALAPLAGARLRLL